VLHAEEVVSHDSWRGAEGNVFAISPEDVRLGDFSCAAGFDGDNDVLSDLEQLAEVFVLVPRDSPRLVTIDLWKPHADRSPLGKLFFFERAVFVLVKLLYQLIV